MHSISTNLRRSLVCLAVSLSAILGVGQARATVMGLSDGAYDVTLVRSCPTINCIGPATGSLAITGSDVTDWMFPIFVDQPTTYSGDPTEEFFGPPVDLEIVKGADSTGNYELEFRYVPGSASFWHVTLSGIELVQGSWSAVRRTDPTPVSEPTSIALLICGLAAIAWVRRRAKNAPEALFSAHHAPG